ncbi:MAG: photosystem II protein PsbQ [Cyanothece sp. SIO1E1]|nr:photosystem II protein PsbQ [Cyanothece sp. SIO1E1]
MNSLAAEKFSVMNLYRSILSLVLVVLTTFMVSCSKPAVTVQPPTYTSEQVEQVQKFAAGLQDLHDRLPTLASFIESENWTNVRTFIRGPLGELRRSISRVSSSLIAPDRLEAERLASSLYDHLISMDSGALKQSAKIVKREYKAMLKDFDALLELVPQA